MTYNCQFCGQEFEFSQDKNKHERTCGISRLSAYGIDTEGIKKVNSAEFSKSTTDSRQLQLDEMVVTSCPVCGSEITEKDKYMDFEKFLECPNCEKVVDVRD